MKNTTIIHDYKKSNRPGTLFQSISFVRTESLASNASGTMRFGIPGTDMGMRRADLEMLRDPCNEVLEDWE